MCLKVEVMFFLLYQVLIMAYTHALTNSLISFIVVFQPVPSQPDPAVVGKVTETSVELSWKPPHHSDSGLGFDSLYYCLEEDADSKKGFVTVYE